MVQQFQPVVAVVVVVAVRDLIGGGRAFNQDAERFTFLTLPDNFLARFEVLELNTHMHASSKYARERMSMKSVVRWRE